MTTATCSKFACTIIGCLSTCSKFSNLGHVCNFADDLKAGYKWRGGTVEPRCKINDRFIVSLGSTVSSLHLFCLHCSMRQHFVLNLLRRWLNLATWLFKGLGLVNLVGCNNKVGVPLTWFSNTESLSTTVNDDSTVPCGLWEEIYPTLPLVLLRYRLAICGFTRHVLILDYLCLRTLSEFCRWFNSLAPCLSGGRSCTTRCHSEDCSELFWLVQSHLPDLCVLLIWGFDFYLPFLHRPMIKFYATLWSRYRL